MTASEWKTLGLFAALGLGISLFSPRIAIVMVLAIALSGLVTKGQDLLNFVQKGQ